MSDVVYLCLEVPATMIVNCIMCGVRIKKKRSLMCVETLTKRAKFREQSIESQSETRTRSFSR